MFGAVLVIFFVALALRQRLFVLLCVAALVLTGISPFFRAFGPQPTLEAVLADTAGLAHLNLQRVGVLDNVKVRLEVDAAVSTKLTGGL
mgnify:CR=1 FL=1